jgi:hypothetical protein
MLKHPASFVHPDVYLHSMLYVEMAVMPTATTTAAAAGPQSSEAGAPQATGVQTVAALPCHYMSNWPTTAL